MGFTRLFLFTFLLIVQIANAQTTDKNVTISGLIKEESSGEYLPGVIIAIEGTSARAFSNSYGFYSLTYPSGDSISIVFSYFGYRTEKVTVPFRKNLELNIALNTEVTSLREVVLNGDRFKSGSDGAQLGHIEIPVQQIKDVPALMGEKDVFKVLQLMPGVQKAGEGSGGLYVRGGGQGENLVILDGATIYNPYHLFGFFSLFNGDALKSVELIKGGFPARYGGRLSSVVEMNMKEGNKKKIAGEAGIGLIASRLLLEGPLLKNKSSFLVSARRTYIDALIYPFLNKEQKAGYYFYDFNAKLNYEFSVKNKIYLSAYVGNDKFYTRSVTSYDDYRNSMKWGNMAATFRWNHLYSEKVFSNTSLVFSRYVLDIFSKATGSGDYSYSNQYFSGIKDFSVKHDIEYTPSVKHTIRTGLISTFHIFTPEAVAIDDQSGTDNVEVKHDFTSFESGVYLEDVFRPAERLTLNAGVRLASFITKNKSHFNPEPRIAAGYKFTSNLAFKAGYTLMNQYVHLLTASTIGLPTDLWVPVTARVKPSRSRQIAAGFVKDFPLRKISVSLEGYYKESKNVLGYKENSSFLLLAEQPDILKKKYKSWENNVTSGRGWSYGAEFLLQKKTGRLSGWIGYTLSWTTLQFDSINLGEKFYAKYDRRHDISVVSIFKINKKIKVSGTWVYGTGNAITLSRGEYSAPVHDPQHGVYQQNGAGQIVLQDYGPRNGFRIKPYHRLDLGIQFDKELRKNRTRTWEISIYNVYNRKNTFFYFTDYKEVSPGVYKSVLMEQSLFPILPSISYHIKF
jgi:hypothetical protein